MQCKNVLTFVLSFLVIAVSAAPIPDSTTALVIPSGEIASVALFAVYATHSDEFNFFQEHAPFVGMTDVARETEPDAEQARACRLYACI
ncbi:hypothetical protein K438DRAFT_599649 [Mycena galopus ATCC 62051]|nr:hypothetical protein K438DRAFT_599649 [Mycena galopus ATCC 62051]